MLPWGAGSRSMPWRSRCSPRGYAAPGKVPCQGNMQECQSKLIADSSPRKIVVTCKSPVGDISAVTLIRTDTTLDHSQKAEKVCLLKTRSGVCARGRSPGSSEHGQSFASEFGWRTGRWACVGAMCGEVERPAAPWEGRLVRSVLLQLSLIEACRGMHKLNELQARDRSSRTTIGSEIVKTELKGSL